MTFRYLNIIKTKSSWQKSLYRFISHQAEPVASCVEPGCAQHSELEPSFSLREEGVPQPQMKHWLCPSLWWCWVQGKPHHSWATWLITPPNEVRNAWWKNNQIGKHCPGQSRDVLVEPHAVQWHCLVPAADPLDFGEQGKWEQHEPAFYILTLAAGTHPGVCSGSSSSSRALRAAVASLHGSHFIIWEGRSAGSRENSHSFQPLFGTRGHHS